MRWPTLLVGAMIAFAWLTPVHAEVQPPAPPWEAPLARQTPLTGQIRAIRDGAKLTPDALIDRLSKADFVLLGERHDNPGHHRLQAWIAEQLFARNRPYALAFEMIDSSQNEALARYLATSPRDAAGLGAALHWEKSGWPAWTHYQPIAEAALSRGLPILAANLSPVLVRAIAKNGLAALPAPLARSLQLDPEKDSAVLTAHMTEIQAVHCGLLPVRSLSPFAIAQYARDAEMARVMTDQWHKSQERDGVVLIAGAGHARTDRGVPFHLSRMAPDAQVLSLAFIEASDGQTADADLSGLPYDFVWVTARVDDTDHCDQIRSAH